MLGFGLGKGLVMDFDLVRIFGWVWNGNDNSMG